MADINKCDIEGETRTAYRLKEGVDWLEVKDALINMWFDEKGNPINSDLKFNSLLISPTALFSSTLVVAFSEEFIFFCNLSNCNL